MKHILFVLALLVAHTAVAQDEIKVWPNDLIDVPLPVGVIEEENYPFAVVKLREHDGLALNIKSHIWDIDVYLVDSEGELEFREIDLKRGVLVFEATNFSGLIGISTVVKKGRLLKWTPEAHEGYVSPETGVEYSSSPSNAQYVYEGAVPFGMTQPVYFRNVGRQ